MRACGLLLSVLLCLPALSAPDEGPQVSRLIVYDTRGAAGNETILILDQKQQTVKIWYQNYLGKRTGRVPCAEYLDCFESMRRIQNFALKPEYRGRPLRATAAHGSVTLAWQDEAGKQIQTIRYYAPEHTLEDFRSAFNRIWGLSRYAILSLSSFESPKLEYREDALFYLARGEIFTLAELESVVAYYRETGITERVARSVWNIQDQNFPPQSEFANRDFLDYCLRQAMSRLGPPALDYLQKKYPQLHGRKRILADQILAPDGKSP